MVEVREGGAQVDPGRTWDLGSVYADDAAWSADFASAEATLPSLADQAGRLGESPEALAAVLARRDEIQRCLERLYVYASMVNDLDSADPRGQELVERVEGLWSRFAATAAYVLPEVLRIPADTLTAWRDGAPALAAYRRAIDETLRLGAHVRSSEVEEVLAELGEVCAGPAEIATTLRAADLDFGTIRDADGRREPLTEATYRALLESRDRRVRRAAFRGVMAAYRAHRNVLASCLAGSVHRDVVEARIRRYPSSLDAALDQSDIPVALCHNVVTTARAHLGLLHRYLRLRARILGLARPHVYDLLVPIGSVGVEQVELSEAIELVVGSAAPLGDEYADALRRGLVEEGWLDAHPRERKRSGAYSGGAYSTRPFILMNYTGRLSDAFVLAHEAGHSMHSWRARRDQPYPSGHCPPFATEVAAIVNEELLRDSLLRGADRHDGRRAALLGAALDEFHGTFFYQALFTEFELEIHRAAERGEALTAEMLSRLYQRLMDEYYGAATVVDPIVRSEWAQVPHFYTPFYVFQYATGIAAAIALARRLLEGGRDARLGYLAFLSAGGSASPLALLRTAGVDMASPEPLERALSVFAARVDELDQALPRPRKGESTRV